MGENSVRVHIINHHASFVWGGKSVGGHSILAILSLVYRVLPFRGGYGQLGFSEVSVI